MIVKFLRGCGGCCSSSEELQGVLKTNDAEDTGVEIQKIDAGADSSLVDETHDNLNEPLAVEKALNGLGSKSKLKPEVLKEFRAKLSQGIKYPVILEDGNTSPCELKLLVDERENRKELMMSCGGENHIMRFEDIHQAKAGKDLGTVWVPIPLDDLCGTIVLKSNDCVSFKFSSIEARDHFVDCMNDVIYSYTMIIEDTGCLDELDTLKDEQAPTVTSAEEQVELLQLVETPIQFVADSSDLCPASVLHLKSIGKLMKSPKFSKFGLMALGYMAVGVDNAPELSLVQCQRVRELLVDEGVRNPIAIRPARYGNEQGPRVSLSLASSVEVLAEYKAEGTKDAVVEVEASQKQDQLSPNQMSLTKGSEAVAKGDEVQVDGEPPCTLESFNGHWFSDRHGSKMGEIRDGTIRWEAASFKKYMKSDHQLEPMKIDFTDNRIHISVWNGMHFASKSEDKLIWSDGDIWRRTEK